MSPQADVIVIGTGIGGGTLGRKLAEAGRRVLFLEKGAAGARREETPLDPSIFVPEARLARGMWPAPMHARIDGRDSIFHGPIGAGLGGSSVFYAATLERPERHDIEHSTNRPHPTGGWPVGYDTLAPFYAEAERLYRICGSHDPLSPEPDPGLPEAPAPGDVDESFRRSFGAAGLHPYRLHSAIAYLEGCRNCLGHKCPRPCKMDGRSAGVEPALETGNATLIDRCTVTRIAHGAGGVTHVDAVRDGTAHRFAARAYVLAGGAFGSPKLWMRSDLPDASGMVGRNLMFHLNEMIALWPRDRAVQGPSKALSLRDLYHLGGQRFGTVQAMGIDVSYGEIVHFLTGMVERSALAHLPGRGLAIRAAAATAARLFGQAKVFVGLLEDLPYARNRVLARDDDVLAFDYTIHPELRARRKAFRRAMRAAFKGHRKWFLSMQPELNFGHPCGTLRFGTDPATSVIDPAGRAHQIGNLWVADASFLPSSMGVNPSLTIAAQALRTADAVQDHLTKGDAS